MSWVDVRIPLRGCSRAMSDISEAERMMFQAWCVLRREWSAPVRGSRMRDDLEERAKRDCCPANLVGFRQKVRIGPTGMAAAVERGNVVLERWCKSRPRNHARCCATGMSQRGSRYLFRGRHAISVVCNFVVLGSVKVRADQA